MPIPGDGCSPATGIRRSFWTWCGSATRNAALAAFLAKETLTFLHTSGHAAAEDIAALCRTLRPKQGVIPIHGETPERLSTLLPDMPVHLLQDGEPFEL